MQNCVSYYMHVISETVIHFQLEAFFIDNVYLFV